MDYGPGSHKESGMTEHISLIFGGIAFQSLVSSAVGN